MRVRLDEEDFRTLVRGGIVTQVQDDGTRVLILLADLGYDRIVKAIMDAIEGS
jgi:hypothetical protein